MTNKKELADVLRRIRELPAEQQGLVLNELQGEELSRMAEPDELLGSTTLSDDLLGSLSSIDLTPPSLDEVEKTLLAAIDQRIVASNRLKEYIRTAVGPYTKERIREWRQQAKADQSAEQYLRTCRDLYGKLLKE